MPERFRLLAVDIDGTLLDSQHQLPQANVTALRRAHGAGLEVVLVTGRRHAFALPIARELGFEVCLISSNGAITRTAKGDLFHADFLPVGTARELCARMDEFRGHAVFTFEAEGRGAMACENADELNRSIRGWVEKNRDSIFFIQPLERALVKDPIQGMYCGSIARMRPAEKRLRSYAEQGKITVLKTQYDHRDLCILDVLNKGCSKGRALERWTAARGIAAQQVVAIGDNYNDIEMLDFAGQAFIMENASEELKRNGYSQTSSNDSCGVAAVIEQVLG